MAVITSSHQSQRIQVKWKRRHSIIMVNFYGKPTSEWSKTLITKSISITLSVQRQMINGGASIHLLTRLWRAPEISVI